MFEWLADLFDTTGFPPRWECGTGWTEPLGWMHILSDLAIFGAYVTIPLVLMYFVLRRVDVPFPRIFWLFVAFIASCGATHLLEAVIFWQPVYRLAGVAKFVTAVASWATVLALVPVIPEALALPGLRQVNQKLQEEVTERHRAEARLLDQTRALQRSNDDLEQFAYVASHDLKQPLRTIGSYVGLLERRYKGELDQDADEYIRYAVDGVKRMQALLDDLLDYSRAGQGEYSTLVALEDVVREVEQDLAPDLAETEGELRVEGILPQLRGSHGELLQVLSNLIGNAVKYRSPDHPPRVEVSATPRGSQWEIAIGDNGIGIAPQHAERVFQLFQRLHTHDEYPGTGIGLALVRKVVENRGGRVWFEPQPSGLGTVFRFTWPAATPPR